MTAFPTPVAIVAASLVLALAAALRAEPVDPLDPTPRPVQVEIEVSPDPGAFGLAWSAPMTGSFSYEAFVEGFSQITLPGAVYEDFLETYGLPAGFILIPGTVTDFMILIHRTSGDVLAGGEWIFNPGIGFGTNGTLTRGLTTFGPGGYFQYSGVGAYYACAGPVPFGTCFPVSASAYDPETGLFNAPGTDTITHPDVGPGVIPLYAWYGEMRLSEAAPAVPALPVGWPLALYGLVVAAALRGSKKAGASARRRSQMRWRG
jgi:hypothetical protein